MQQVESLVCGGDRKIVCETLIADDHDPNPKPTFTADPDFPAESFRIPRDQEQDWVENNAFLYRNPSTKQQPQSLQSQSQRLSVKKTKSSIFGLPEIQYSGRLCAKSRPARIHFFPKRNFSSNRSSGSNRVPEIEPGSPKVSCMGRVKSKRDKKRRKKKKKEQELPAAGGKTGMWVKLTGFLRLGRRGKITVERIPEKSPAEDFNNSRDEEDVVGRFSVDESVAPPSLGALKRFTSGRKSDSMGSAVEFESVEAGGNESGLESELASPCGGKISARGAAPALDGGGIWRRRAAEMPRSVDCVRDWGKVGPASV